MPANLMQAMPALVLGLAALAWIGWRRARPPHRDLAVGLALAASWFAVWGLYAGYTWTAQPGGSTLQVARFYVPALGAIALLGAWLVTRLPHRETTPALGALACTAVIAVMFGIGTASFHAMVQSPMGGGGSSTRAPGTSRDILPARYAAPPSPAGPLVRAYSERIGDEWLDIGLEPFLIQDMENTDASGSKGPSRRLFLSASAVAAATVPLVSQATAASAASGGTHSGPPTGGDPTRPCWPC